MTISPMPHKHFKIQKQKTGRFALISNKALNEKGLQKFICPDLARALRGPANWLLEHLDWVLEFSDISVKFHG